MGGERLYLFWLGSVTNEEFEEEIAHDQICEICKKVSLQSSEYSVAHREDKVGTQIEENYNSITWREQRHRPEFRLLQRSGTGGQS